MKKLILPFIFVLILFIFTSDISALGPEYYDGNPYNNYPYGDHKIRMQREHESDPPTVPIPVNLGNNLDFLLNSVSQYDNSFYRLCQPMGGDNCPGNYEAYDSDGFAIWVYVSEETTIPWGAKVDDNFALMDITNAAGDIQCDATFRILTIANGNTLASCFAPPATCASGVNDRQFILSQGWHKLKFAYCDIGGPDGFEFNFLNARFGSPVIYHHYFHMLHTSNPAEIDNMEGDEAGECSDGIDNDGDWNVIATPGYENDGYHPLFAISDYQGKVYNSNQNLPNPHRENFPDIGELGVDCFDDDCFQKTTRLVDLNGNFQDGTCEFNKDNNIELTCDDGLDNDWDGKIDLADSDCRTGTEDCSLIDAYPGFSFNGAATDGSDGCCGDDPNDLSYRLIIPNGDGTTSQFLCLNDSNSDVNNPQINNDEGNFRWWNSTKDDHEYKIHSDIFNKVEPNKAGLHSNNYVSNSEEWFWCRASDITFRAGMMIQNPNVLSHGAKLFYPNNVIESASELCSYPGVNCNSYPCLFNGCGDASSSNVGSPFNCDADNDGFSDGFEAIVSHEPDRLHDGTNRLELNDFSNRAAICDNAPPAGYFPDCYADGLDSSKKCRGSGMFKNSESVFSCRSGFDNDLDGNAGCDDIDCHAFCDGGSACSNFAGPIDCTVNPIEDCNTPEDDDNNFLTNCEDPACSDFPGCLPLNPTSQLPRYLPNDFLCVQKPLPSYDGGVNVNNMGGYFAECCKDTECINTENDFDFVLKLGDYAFSELPAATRERPGSAHHLLNHQNIFEKGDSIFTLEDHDEATISFPNQCWEFIMSVNQPDGSRVQRNFRWSDYDYFEFDIFVNNILINTVTLFNQEHAQKDFNMPTYSVNGWEVRKWHRIKIPMSDIADANFRPDLTGYDDGKALQTKAVIKMAAANCNGESFKVDDIVLSKYSGDRNEDFFCAPDYKKWVQGFQPVNHGVTRNNNPILYDAYIENCNAQNSYDWTGSWCCGASSLPGSLEYYTEDNQPSVACFAGQKINHDQKVSEVTNDLNDESIKFYDGKFHSCDINFARTFPSKPLGKPGISGNFENVHLCRVVGDEFCYMDENLGTSGWNSTDDENKVFPRQGGFVKCVGGSMIPVDPCEIGNEACPNAESSDWFNFISKQCFQGGCYLPDFGDVPGSYPVTSPPPGITVNDRCVENGAIVGHHICADYEWTTKTSVMVSILRSNTLANDDYSIYCDDAENAVTYRDPSISTWPATHICTMKRGDDVIALMAAIDTEAGDVDQNRRNFIDIFNDDPVQLYAHQNTLGGFDPFIPQPINLNTCDNLDPAKSSEFQFCIGTANAWIMFNMDMNIILISTEIMNSVLPGSILDELDELIQCIINPNLCPDADDFEIDLFSNIEGFSYQVSNDKRFIGYTNEKFYNDAFALVNDEVIYQAEDLTKLSCLLKNRFSNNWKIGNQWYFNHSVLDPPNDKNLILQDWNIFAKKSRYVEDGTVCN